MPPVKAQVHLVSFVQFIMRVYPSLFITVVPYQKCTYSIKFLYLSNVIEHSITVPGKLAVSVDKSTLCESVIIETPMCMFVYVH